MILQVRFDIKSINNQAVLRKIIDVHLNLIIFLIKGN